MRVCRVAACPAGGKPQPIENFYTRRERGRVHYLTICKTCHNHRSWDYQRERKRALREAQLLDAGPLVEWLWTIGGPQEISAATGVSDRTLRDLMHQGRVGVRLDTVDRLCIELGTSLETIYPLESS